MLVYRKRALTPSGAGLLLPPPLSLPSHLAEQAEVRRVALETVFLSHLYIKMMILPRQARDKHREATQKRDRFLAGAAGCA
eukprot:COSAG06_NODE_6739_length_2801_cov_3.127636_1_plen_81_part_00